MKFDIVAAHLAGIPFITAANARRLYDFILEYRPVQCLELGFAHGTSSCYIAAALHELGQGHLTTVDLMRDDSRSPSIEQLLDRTGLRSYVTPVREATSYTWFLKKQLEKHGPPRYDFCFIDGAKNWTIDGLAFFLVDRLLNEGGWILFDDYSWSYAEHARHTGKQVSDGIHHRELDQDELEQPHVRLIFQLLVMQHPDYSHFRIEDDAWAWARKVRLPQRVLEVDTNVRLRARAVAAARRIVRRLPEPLRKRIRTLVP